MSDSRIENSNALYSLISSKKTMYFPLDSMMLPAVMVIRVRRKGVQRDSPSGLHTTKAKVKRHGNCHVQFEQCLYSPPFSLVGRELWLKATETSVKIFHDLSLVATHPRLRKPAARSTVEEHLPPEAVAYRMQDPQWCLRQAREIVPHCLAVIESLFSDRVLDHLRAAQGIVRLAKTFGAVRLEAACLRALPFEDPRYRTVKTILEGGLDQLPTDSAADPDLPDAYRGEGRFCRNIASLLLH